MQMFGVFSRPIQKAKVSVQKMKNKMKKQKLGILEYKKISKLKMKQEIRKLKYQEIRKNENDKKIRKLRKKIKKMKNSKK